MKLVTDHQKTLKQIKQALDKNMPITVVGMVDGGKNFLFGNFTQEKVGIKTRTVKIDLSTCYGDESKTLELLNLSFLNSDLGLQVNSFKDLAIKLLKVAKKEKLLLVINVGYRETINDQLVLCLYNLRNLLGYKINWVVFANYGFINTEKIEVRDIFEKIFFAEIIAMKPLNRSCIEPTIESMRYRKQLTKSQIEEINKLSGGHSGFIRSLCQLAIREGNLKEWENDLSLMARARKVAFELRIEEKKALLDKKNERSSLVKKLRTFGYLDDRNKVFSPILKKALLSMYKKRVELKDLTVTQESIWSVLKEKEGQIVNRDEVGQAMWGRLWEQKYSDWAIDQAIYSLRQRLIELGIEKKILTKRGKGFLLER